MLTKPLPRQPLSKLTQKRDRPVLPHLNYNLESIRRPDSTLNRVEILGITDDKEGLLQRRREKCLECADLSQAPLLPTCCALHLKQVNICVILLKVRRTVKETR